MSAARDASAAPRLGDARTGAQDVVEQHQLSERPPRADSVRNRARILEAAEAVFGDEGLAVPIDRVAERAGVGVGTVYRHFPTKESLFVAIVMRHFERLLAEARTLQDSPDPSLALRSFLRRIVSVASEKRALADALVGAGIDFKAAAGDLKTEMDATLEGLFDRAQAEGAIRRDVSFSDLMNLVGGACMGPAAQFGPLGSSPDKMLDIIFAGLRPGA
jgi:AcrR family transcriptional regulator